MMELKRPLNKFLHLFRVHTGQGRNIIVGVIKLTCRDLYPRRVLRERERRQFSFVEGHRDAAARATKAILQRVCVLVASQSCHI